MRVLHVSSELYPVLKTGGLADVAAALPAALRGLSVDARVLVPGHPQVLDAAVRLDVVFSDHDLFGGGPARVLAGELEQVDSPVFVLDCPGLFERNGNPYIGPGGFDWMDNHRRFAALSWAAASLGLGADPYYRPEIVHAHDWQTGLAAIYLELWGDPRPKSVFTIHNLGYQGVFPAAYLDQLALPVDAHAIEGVEFYGSLSFLKAGLYYSDRITTVSPTYASEIQTPEGGQGMDGLLTTRRGDLSGILNGVDYGVWDPSHDPHLPLRYDAASVVAGKREAKRELQRRFDLSPDLDAPLFGVVSRLSGHKGLDLLLGAATTIFEGGGQLLVLGSGAPDLEHGFRELSRLYPGRAAVHIGYDERLSHLVQAGSDVILVPSRSEPCGLTQLYAMRYGSLPLARRTGGLADSIINADPVHVAAGTATGMLFDDATVEALAGTLRWACDLFQDQAGWRAMQRAAMGRDFGWHGSAKQYRALYEDLVGHLT